MNALERARAGTKRMLARFPSETVTLMRPAKNKYGEKTDARTTIATATIWLSGAKKPTGWKIDKAAQKYDDAGDVWASMPYADAPEVEHGDVVVFKDGTEKVIRNIQGAGTDVRVFWQLSEV